MKSIVVFAIFLLPCYAFSQIINVEKKRITVDSTGIYGNIDLNFSVQKTTKSLVSITNGGFLTYYNPKYQIMLFGQYSLVSGEGEKFANNGFGHLRYNRRLSQFIELEIFSQSQFNSLTKIDQRLLNGIGARFQLTDYDNALFYWGLAYMNEYEKVAGLTDDLSANRASSYFSFSLTPQEDVSFSSITYVQPRFSKPSDYRVLNQNSLSLSITEKLSLSITFNVSYDSATPEGVPNLTYDLFNGLKYKFGK